MTPIPPKQPPYISNANATVGRTIEDESTEEELVEAIPPTSEKMEGYLPVVTKLTSKKPEIRNTKKRDFTISNSPSSKSPKPVNLQHRSPRVLAPKLPSSAPADPKPPFSSPAFSTLPSFEELSLYELNRATPNSVRGSLYYLNIANTQAKDGKFELAVNNCQLGLTQEHEEHVKPYLFLLLARLLVCLDGNGVDEAKIEALARSNVYSKYGFESLADFAWRVPSEKQLLLAFHKTALDQAISVCQEGLKLKHTNQIVKLHLQHTLRFCQLKKTEKQSDKAIAHKNNDSLPAITNRAPVSSQNPPPQAPKSISFDGNPSKRPKLPSASAPPTMTHSEIASFLLEQGSYELAISACQAGLKLEHYDQALKAKLTEILDKATLKKDQLEQANKHLQSPSAPVASPTVTNAIDHLKEAISYYKQGKSELVIKACQEGLKLEYDQVVKAKLFLLLGRAFETTNQFDSAIIELKKGLSLCTASFLPDIKKAITEILIRIQQGEVKRLQESLNS
jgi:tetratricopeptide (TPR) repeat protein